MAVQNNRKILFGFPFREYIRWMVEYFHIIDSVKRSISPNLIYKIQIFIWIPALLCTVKLYLQLFFLMRIIYIYIEIRLHQFWYGTAQILTLSNIRGTSTPILRERLPSLKLWNSKERTQVFYFEWYNFVLFNLWACLVLLRWCIWLTLYG